MGTILFLTLANKRSFLDSFMYTNGSSFAEKSSSQAVDLLMATPPLPEEDVDARKENKLPLFASSSKNPLPMSPERPQLTSERPQLQQFQLNLLPVPDIGTPEMQHFKSVLKRN